MLQVMAQIKAQGHRSCRQNLMMFYHLILCSSDCTYHNWLYAQIEQMRNLVGNGLACCAPIHVEAMREHQPNLSIVVTHTVFEVQQLPEIMLTDIGKLDAMQLRIYTVLCQQFTMCPRLDDLALLQHDDTVSIFNGG